MKNLFWLFPALFAIQGTGKAQNVIPSTFKAEKYLTESGEKLTIESRILNENKERSFLKPSPP